MTIIDLGFITVTIRDLIDVGLVTFIFYQLYKLVKGSLAVNIVIGLISIYLLFLLVDLLELRLLARILGQFIGVGVISLIILFQPEIRRFLLLIGRNTAFKQNGWIKKIFVKATVEGIGDEEDWQEISEASMELAAEKTGALLVFAKTSELQFFANTGEMLDARINKRLLISIFNKTSPLHDGAVIIANGRIKAAGCILPMTENPDLPDDLGMRHRSALGISEHSDAVVVVVSEETGRISIAVNGQLESIDSRKALVKRMQLLLSN